MDEPSPSAPPNMDEPSPSAPPDPETPVPRRSDKLAAAVERAAEAALKRAPRSLDLGGLADNAAFHVLVGWRLRKSRRSDPFEQEFFQKILFDAMVEPGEASRGIAGYLLTYRADSFSRKKRWSDGFNASFWILGVLAVAAGAAWAAVIMEHGLPAITAEGVFTACCVATIGGLFVKALVEGGKEWRLASGIESAARAIASKHSTSALVELDIGSALDGCGCLLVFGMSAWLAVMAALLTGYAYLQIGSETCAAAWALAVPLALMAGVWRYSTLGAAERERAELKENLETWLRARWENGSPPSRTS